MIRNTFVKNSFIISMGIIISKLLSLLYIFPFSSLVGKQGMALYSYAYVPYSIFIDLATLGIPLGTSKIISKYVSLKEHYIVKKIFNHSLLLMIIIGFFGFLIMVLLSDFYANLVLGGNDLDNSLNDVSHVIKIIAFSLLIIPSISVLRGFFQGHQIMYPTSISQILEQFVRVLTILIGSYIIIKVLKKSVLSAVSISVFAAFLGGLTALVYLLYVFKKNKSKSTPIDYVTNKSSKSIYKELFIYAIPFVIYGLNFSLYQFVDSVTFNKGMLAFGVSKPEFYYGIYSFEIQKLIFIPVSIMSAIGISLMPNITDYLYKNERKKLLKNIIIAFSLVLIFSTLSFCAYYLFSDFIYKFLYDYNKIGPYILKIYAPLIFLFCLSNLTLSVMQGLEIGKYLFFSISLGVLLKIFLNYNLISMYGVKGAILSTVIGYTITVLLNIIIIIKNLITIRAYVK